MPFRAVWLHEVANCREEENCLFFSKKKKGFVNKRTKNLPKPYTCPWAENQSTKTGDWEHFAFPGNIDFLPPMTKAHFVVFIHRLWNNVYHRWIRNNFPCKWHKQNKCLQILVQEDFPPKLLWRENADFKFSVNNEEDANEKPRSRENITASLSTARATPTTRDRGTEEQGTGISEALWSFYTVENPHLSVCRFPRRYIDKSL